MKQTFFFLLLWAFQLSFAQDTNISVISVEKANIVYRGIHNPIKIAVPGAKSYKVTSNGEITKKDSLGNFLLNVNGTQGKVAKIFIEATLENGKVIKEEKVFELREISHPTSFITTDYESRVYEMTHEQLENFKIRVHIDNLAFTVDTAYFKVVSFRIQTEGKEELYIKGDKIIPKAYSFIKNLPVGTKLLIKNIRQYNPHNYCMRGLPPIKIILVKEQNIKTSKPEILSDYHNNIIYREIINPLKIIVPNAKAFKVKGIGLSEMLEDSTYTIDVGKIKEDEIFLDFEITAQNDSIFHTKEILYIRDRDLTQKKIIVNGKSCSNCVLKMTLAGLKDAVIDIRVDDEDSSWANIVVDDFEIKMPGGEIIWVQNDRINDEIFQQLSELKKESVFEIRVPYYISHGFTYDPPPLKIMIVDKL